MIEARRSNDCVRQSWSAVLETYPELSLWRKVRDGIQARVWASEEDAGAGIKRNRSGSPKKDRDSDLRKAVLQHPETGRQASEWAKKWRVAIAAVLPSGFDSAVHPLDPEVRKLAKAIWKDVVASMSDTAAERDLDFFRGDPLVEGLGTPARGLAPGTPPAEWSFIPMSDLLLMIGDGLVGITAEGIFAANVRGFQRQSLAKLYGRKGGEDEANGKAAAAAVWESASVACDPMLEKAGASAEASPNKPERRPEALHFLLRMGQNT